MLKSYFILNHYIINLIGHLTQRKTLKHSFYSWRYTYIFYLFNIYDFLLNVEVTSFIFIKFCLILINFIYIYIYSLKKNIFYLAFAISELG